jgi:hypothetical protein
MKIRIGGIVQKLSCIDIVGGGKGRGEESNQGSLKPSKNEPTEIVLQVVPATIVTMKLFRSMELNGFFLSQSRKSSETNWKEGGAC